ncbi:MAG: NAD(P)/FAD-dependent oxidoreductase [Alphaproteobacteria bacterium]
MVDERTGEDADVAVIGAGIVGLASAVFLGRAGARVTLLDALPPGGGASFGNAGLLSIDACVPVSLPGMLRQVPRWLSDPLGPLAVDARYVVKALPWLLGWLRAGRMDNVIASSYALRALHKPGLEQYRELLGPSHFHDLIRTSGQVHVWEGAAVSSAERISRELWARHGVVTETLGPHELNQLIPEISPAVSRAVLFPNNGHTVNPQRLLDTLAMLLREAGGRVRHERVMKILPQEGAGFRVLTNNGDHRFAKVVVAGGAWSKRLLAPLGVRLPLETERGYHAMVRNPSFSLRIPVLHKTKAFGATPMEGGLRFAGTVEIAGLDIPMNERRAEAVLSQGRALFPSLRGEDVSIWMGYRPSLPDSVPVIDEVAARRGLFIACGHGHTGMTAGAVTGRLVSQLVLGAEPMIDRRPYRLARFH